MVAWYSLAVLTASQTLSFVDRKLPFILADSIKQDLNLSDTQLGLVTGVMFAIVLSGIGLPVGMLIDRWSRKHLLAAGVVIWSATTAMGGLAQNFYQLAASRMGVAVGESVCTPGSHSMIADLFTHRYRARAISIYFMGAQLGAILGLGLGGLINELADWRLAMLLLGAPGIILTLVILFTLPEPKRRVTENSAPGAPPPSILTAVLIIVRQPTMVHLIAASALASAASGGLQAFMPSHLIRTFHMGTAEIGITYGLALGLAGISGLFVGGMVGDWLRSRARWQVILFIGAGEALSLPFIVLALVSDSYPSFLALLFVAQVLGSFSAGPTMATLQSLMTPNTHGKLSAFYLFTVVGIGLVLGPLITGMVSDSMSSLGPQASLQIALLILMIPKTWAVLHYLLSALSLRRRDRLMGSTEAG